MFVRVKTAYNRDGSPRQYLQIVKNQRIDGKVQQKVIGNLGRVEDLQDGKLDALVISLAKFARNVAVIDAAQDLFADWSKEYGPSMVFRRLWDTLGLSAILKTLLSRTQITIDVEEAVFCMVLNRLCDPGSKLMVSEWKDDIYRPEFSSLELHHFYRSLDFLAEHKDEIEENLFVGQTNLFNRQLDLVFFDTTSTYFEGQAGEGLAQYGHSKDHRSDRMQILIGILMTREGLPIAHYVFPGNTPDGEAFRLAVADLKQRFPIDRVIVVGDRGMMGKKTLETLQELGLEYILGVRMRKLKEAQEVLSRAGRYSVVKDNLKVKQVFIDEHRYIICLNEEEAEREQAMRLEIIKKLELKLERTGVKGLIGNSGFRKYLKLEGEAAVIDTGQLEQEAFYDGKYVLRTNTELNAKEVALAYRDLWKIERAFRDLKSTIEVRPIYHWNEKRIRGHVAVCFLALVMQSTLQKLLCQADKSASFSEVLRDLKKLHAVKLRLKDKNYIVRTELTGQAHLAFKAVGLRIPPRVVES